MFSLLLQEYFVFLHDIVYCARMKQIKKYITMALVTLVLIQIASSCIEDKSTDPTPECAITAFSISDIKTAIHTLGYKGSDSTYTKTLSGSEVKFNIDQINGRVYNIDSLPNWVDITRVVPTITAYGDIYAKTQKDSIYYYITSGSDSIDFTNPVEMVVTGYDGKSYKKYTVSINKSITDADSLIWNLTDSTLDLTGDFRTLVLNDTVQIFQDGCPVDYKSIQVFDNMFVGLDKSGIVNTSADGMVWTATTLPKVAYLLAVDSYYLHGFNGSSFVSTSDLITWKQSGNNNIDKIPTDKCSSVFFSSKTNSDQNNVVLVGQTPADTTHSVTWYKLSAYLDVVNQDWNYIGITSENNYALPLFSCMSNAFIYNKAIAIIGDGYLYLSYDNGITWKKQTEHLLLPHDFDASLPVQCVVAQDYVFLIQSGSATRKGRLWKGYINKLNPAK